MADEPSAVLGLPETRLANLVLGEPGLGFVEAPDAGGDCWVEDLDISTDWAPDTDVATTWAPDTDVATDWARLPAEEC